MILIPNILLFITAGVLVNVYADECNIIQDKSPRLQLSRYLFCDYDSSERPTRDQKNATDVVFVIVPKLIEFEDYTRTLSVHSWLYVSWYDDYLHWEPSEHNDIKSIRVESHHIWTPDLTLLNAVSPATTQIGLPITNCDLTESGLIFCGPPVLLETQCDADYTYWPFDRQNCSIRISSRPYTSEQITFADKFDVSIGDFRQNGEWNLITVHKEHINASSKYSMYDQFPTVVAHFVIQRTASHLWRIFGTPAAILAAMTLSTLWLDPTSNERLMLGCVDFICHFLCIKNLHWMLPESDALPNILLFYHNSTILTVVALILTCLFRKIIESEDSPPPWISCLVSSILSSKIGQILLLSILDPKASACLEDNADDNSGLVDRPTPRKSTWAYVAIILGWISFMGVFLTYIIMFAIFWRLPNLVK